MNVLETERLILRRLAPDDAAEMFRIYSDPKTMEFMGKGFDSIEDGRTRIQQHIEWYYEKYEFGLWATVLKENNRLIGRCGLLYEEIEGRKDLELAYLIDCNYWGKGLAAEAARAILKIGFDQYQANRIIAVIVPENRNSIRLAERLGMKFEREIASYKDFGRVLLYALNP
jgi:ribosomal-protein-alanine N-acetyltransferase